MRSKAPNDEQAMPVQILFVCFFCLVILLQFELIRNNYAN